MSKTNEKNTAFASALGPMVRTPLNSIASQLIDLLGEDKAQHLTA
jgi:hypothetical protein